jgi:hypothetical protein
MWTDQLSVCSNGPDIDVAILAEWTYHVTEHSESQSVRILKDCHLSLRNVESENNFIWFARECLRQSQCVADHGLIEITINKHKPAE